MYDDKRVGRTIHLPQSMWDYIDERRKVVIRSRSNEVEYSLIKLWEIENKANQEAVNLAKNAKPSQTETKSSE